MEPTPMMATMGAFGYDTESLKAWVINLADLLAKDGAAIADIVRGGVALVGAVMRKDVIGVLTELQQANANWQKIAADIKVIFAD